MKYKPKRGSRFRVALLIGSHHVYGRKLLLSVAQYVRAHDNWSVEFEEGHTGSHLPDWMDGAEWDGILARAETRSLLDSLRGLKVPVVDVGCSLPRSPFPIIRSDNMAVGRMAAEHLLERGFRRFAFYGPVEGDWVNVRRAGFEARVAEAGFSSDVFVNDSRPATGHLLRCEEHGIRFNRKLKTWLRSLPQPVGLMAANDFFGRQTLSCCRETGIRVPDELAVVGVDNDEVLCELSGISLSSVILNTERVGYLASEMLTRLMSGKSAGPQPVLLPPLGIATRRSTDVLAIEDPQVAAALRLIRERACQRLHVESILKRVPLSLRVLERRFVKAIGRTPKAEMLRVQLGRISHLLADSDLPVKAIADEAGFNHVEYMARLFKSKTGMTPGAFRKQSNPKR